MKSFLEYVADDIINKYGTDLSRIAVVFPNKRASLFLDDYLARRTNKPIWSPSYTTISELFRAHSSLTVGDPIKLVCDIHKSFTEVTGIDESLDHFYSWGQLLLSDFDDIDKNMADASKVFANLRDIHELDDISYLDEEQKELLRVFFSNFTDEHNSILKERFIKLWSRFSDIYDNFRNRLLKQNIAYEGMLYRSVATDDSLRFEYDKYLFVGFNVVQKVEQTMFQHLKEQGNAHFYWDYDQYYMSRDRSTNQSINEAGHYISQYLDRFPNELDTDNDDIFSNINSSKPKDITFMNSSTENMQARYVTSWLGENERYKCGRKTAIVLCDESLLQSVIHCIPPEVDKLNITTGYPLANTPVSSFVNQLIELQIVGYSPSSNYFRHKYVAQLLMHPYCQYISPLYAKLRSELRHEGRSYISQERLAVDDNLSKLFTPISGNSYLTAWLAEILRIVANNGGNSEPLFDESLFRMYTLLNRVKSLVDNGDLSVDVITLQKLITQVVASTSIPFHGEPAEGVQIMGVLETRNLDFDHLLILSCNEGNMPKGVNDSSFIPYSIRKAYGLTTVDNKVSIYAYYFYRLLQRAKDVSIAYNDSTEDGHTGEMSRFMLQLMVESPFHINRVTLQANYGRLFNEPRAINKDQHVLSVMNKISYLSPTAINRYLRCQLQFYYDNVAGLTEPDEIEDDEIDNRIFGNIFHSASEKIYNQLLATGNMITTQAIDNVLKHRETIERIVDETIAAEVFHIENHNNKLPKYNGLQLINREVIILYIIRLLEIDRQLAPFSIVGLEKKVMGQISINLNGQSKAINIGGRIDRMDKIHDSATNSDIIRIVDYKTGGAMFKCRINSVEEIFSTPPDASKHADYYLQTLLYSMIVRRNKDYNPQLLPVSPALLFIQHTKEDNYNPIISIGKERIMDIDKYAADFSEHLSNVVSDIFNPNKPFMPTTDSSACALCPYTAICGI